MLSGMLSGKNRRRRSGSFSFMNGRGRDARGKLEMCDQDGGEEGAAGEVQEGCADV